MQVSSALQKTFLLLMAIMLTACTAMDQRADQVLIRDPHLKDYRDPEQTRVTARTQWEFAVMSENAYREGRAASGLQGPQVKAPIGRARLTEDIVRQSCADDAMELPLAGWRKWDFPSEPLKKRMQAEGMYMEIQEKQAPPHTIAVIFEGSTFSDLADWRANLNFLLRFLPGYKDQYVLAASALLDEFYAELDRRRDELHFDARSGQLLRPDGSVVRIVATGHSLGAGLAQYFAYSFRRPAGDAPGPLVNDVYAFNPSPITGWLAAGSKERTESVKGLQIHRIFEHGEVLEYLRLLTSRLGMSEQDPAIWEYRYNFEPSINVISKHSIRRLACGLTMAARPWEKK
jgi:hypothetical protein